MPAGMGLSRERYQALPGLREERDFDAGKTACREDCETPTRDGLSLRVGRLCTIISSSQSPHWMHRHPGRGPLWTWMCSWIKRPVHRGQLVKALPTKCLEHFFEAFHDAAKDWRVTQGITAAFCLSKCHDQIEKVFRLIRFEGDHEFLIIQTK